VQDKSCLSGALVDNNKTYFAPWATPRISNQTIVLANDKLPICSRHLICNTRLSMHSVGGLPTTTASAEVSLLRGTLSKGLLLVEADAGTGGVPDLELALVGMLAGLRASSPLLLFWVRKVNRTS